MDWLPCIRSAPDTKAAPATMSAPATLSAPDTTSAPDNTSAPDIMSALATTTAKSAAPAAPAQALHSTLLTKSQLRSMEYVELMAVMARWGVQCTITGYGTWCTVH